MFVADIYINRHNQQSWAQEEALTVGLFNKPNYDKMRVKL